jgi:hypothetical protein
MNRSRCSRPAGPCRTCARAEALERRVDAFEESKKDKAACR